jgi:hypothetical protein
MKRVRCIDAAGGRLDQGKIYEVEDKYEKHGEMFYRINGGGWLASRFEVVVEDDTAVAAPAATSPTPTQADAPALEPFDFDKYNGVG